MDTVRTEAAGTVESGNSLVFSLSEFESDPSGAKTYVTLDVEARSGSFSGVSACVLAEPDLAEFLEQLEALARSATGEALLVGGWGSTENVRIRAFPADRQGHLRIQAVLAEVPDHEARSQLEAFFETEPQPVLRLVSALRLAISERKAGEFRLFVRGGPAT